MDTSIVYMYTSSLKWNARGGTRLRGPENLGPLEASEFDPSFQQFRVNGNPLPDPLSGAPGPFRGPAEAEALQGPRRGVFVFNGAGEEGGPLRGPQERSRFPGNSLKATKVHNC